MFKEPAEGSSRSTEGTVHRVFAIGNNRAIFVSILIFTKNICIWYRGRVVPLERVESVPAIADVPLVPFLDQRGGGRCGENITFVIGIHFP